MTSSKYQAGYAAYGNGKPFYPVVAALDRQAPGVPLSDWLRGWQDARTDSYRNGGSLYPNANA